jgi:hypothetical protein
MTQRLVRIGTLVAMFGLGALASRLPLSNAAETAPPAAAAVLEALCPMRCEQKYEACVLLGAIINTQGMDCQLGTPSHGPANEVPGCWPFAPCYDTSSDPVKRPRCLAERDECASACAPGPR